MASGGFNNMVVLLSWLAVMMLPLIVDASYVSKKDPRSYYYKKCHMKHDKTETSQDCTTVYEKVCSNVQEQHCIRASMLWTSGQALQYHARTAVYHGRRKNARQRMSSSVISCSRNNAPQLTMVKRRATMFPRNPATKFQGKSVLRSPGRNATRCQRRVVPLFPWRTARLYLGRTVN